MELTEFTHALTSTILNESLADRFGYSINLEGFSDMQLADAQNKLRTRISQFELTENFDSVTTNKEYQKTKLFLEVINQAILERENAPEDTEAEDGEDEDEDEEVGLDEHVYYATIRERAKHQSVPGAWIDSAINRISLGESSTDELKAELTTRYDLNESTASWLLCEGEELRAEIIMATRDMIDRVTGWIEDVAAMKAEQLLELLDSIKGELGPEVAQQYQGIVKPALERIYGALEQSRSELTQGLSIISGGQIATMGELPAPNGMPSPDAPPAVPGIPGAGAPNQSMAGSMPAPGEGEGEVAPAVDVGREKRESVEYSRRLGLLLSSKKK